MIIGIGSDLIDIRRVEKSIERFGERFTNRCFTDVERARSDRRANRAWRLYERLADHNVDDLPIDTDLAEHPPLPTTSIYSRDEAIVPAASSIAPPTPLFESIGIRGSHIGMPWNPAVLRVVLDRLAQPEGAWKPYRR